MDLPEAMIETQCETMVEEFAQRIAQSGLTMEQYLQFSGMTVDQLKDQVRPEATTRIQSSLVLEQIAKEENIEVTDADIDAEVEKMAKAYGMEADKLKEYMGDAEKESMKKDLAITKAVDLIMDNVKERAKAKKRLMQKSLQKNKILNQDLMDWLRSLFLSRSLSFYKGGIYMSLVPYVIEQTSRGERNYDIYSRLLKIVSFPWRGSK